MNRRGCNERLMQTLLTLFEDRTRAVPPAGGEISPVINNGGKKTSKGAPVGENTGKVHTVDNLHHLSEEDIRISA